MNLNHMPTTWAALTGKVRLGDTQRIGNNTDAENDGGTVRIYLHGHEIVRVTRTRVEFSLAGYPTTTTRDRVNRFLPARYHVRQVDFAQYLCDRWDGLEALIGSDEWVSVPQDFPAPSPTNDVGIH